MEFLKLLIINLIKKMELITNLGEHLILGVNWGGVKVKGWFGIDEYEKADLDFTIAVLKNGDFDNQNFDNIELYNFNNNYREGITINEDDFDGDLSGNDHKDNECILLDFRNIDENDILIPFIYKYSKVSWNKLSHLEFRIYTGNASKVVVNIYFKDLLLENNQGEIALKLGYIHNDNNTWKYENKIEHEIIKTIIETKLDPYLPF